MASELPLTIWKIERDGITYTSELREAEPGVYHVSTELMHQLLREIGWVPVVDDGK